MICLLLLPLCLLCISVQFPTDILYHDHSKSINQVRQPLLQCLRCQISQRPFISTLPLPSLFSISLLTTVDSLTQSKAHFVDHLMITEYTVHLNLLANAVIWRWMFGGRDNLISGRCPPRAMSLTWQKLACKKALLMNHCGKTKGMGQWCGGPQVVNELS